ncbi:MAG: hypothetical protein Unbinned2299contig1000_11 [Prokaryotic dsDNA virus sp.]|jgi:hypothetical protein|nr:MAG: hypothetical protein Unbinned2299contig1000_11 [Prokaryotic dsDNA virus sp.]|tara:strand:+ start:4803 stop:5042 length:240 start_codon:yes stop_codon:yes gene_type:complete
MADKITTDELDSLRSLQRNLYESRLDLGDVQVAISRLQTKSKSLVFDIENHTAELNKFREGLDKKYGDKKVDLMTGAIT